MSKSAQTKLLFLIAAFSKNANDWIDVLSSPFPRISGYPKRDKTIKKAIAQLLEKRLLDYKKEKEAILIKPTHKAFEQLSLSYPYYRNFYTKWDGRFRLVIYDVAERERRKRDALRRILRLLHLGMLQNSVWITPHDIKAQMIKKLEESNLHKNIELLEAQLFSGDEKEFAQKIWQVNKLNDDYKELYQSLTKIARKPKAKRTMIAVFRKSFLTYQRLLEVDPGLPDKLLPSPWFAHRARAMLRKLQKMI